jgi:transcriptional regulator with XRE-family HTH domain
MDSNLQRKIKVYLESTGLSVAALERQAGLKTNVARNILRGQSKKPTGETLQAIAAVMECSIQDLLQGGGGSGQMKDYTPPKLSPVVEYPELLNEALCCILKTAKNNGYKLTLQQITLILEEVYAYTIKKAPPNIDMDFIEWFVKRTIR